MTCQNCRAVPIVLVFLPASNNSCIRITTLCMVGCSRINQGENLAGKGKRNSPISCNNHSLQLKEQIYKNLHLEFLPHQLCQIVHVLTTTTYKTNTCSFLHSAGKKKLMGFGHLIFHHNSTSDSFNSIPGSRTDMLCFGKMSRKKVLSSPVPLHEAPNLQPQEALSYQWQLGYAANLQRSSLSSLPHPQHRKIERQVSFLVCKPKKHMPQSLSIRKEKLYTICQGICHHFLEKKENKNLLFCECFLC